MAKATKSDGGESLGGIETKATSPPISNYADPTIRQYPPLISMGFSLLLYSMYLFCSMIPLIIPLFCYFGLYLEWIPAAVLKGLGTAIVIDLIVPLGNGYRPNPKFKKAIDRLCAEGGQQYFPARSIFLPGPNLSREKAYILAAFPHGLFGGGNHFGFADFESVGIFPLYSGASVMNYVPFVRRLFSLLGFTEVTKQGLQRVLDVQRFGPTYPYNVVHLVR